MASDTGVARDAMFGSLLALARVKSIVCAFILFALTCGWRTASRVVPEPAIRLRQRAKVHRRCKRQVWQFQQPNCVPA